MRYIVLDANCLLQSLPSKSPYHKIWTDVLAGEISFNTYVHFNLLPGDVDDNKFVDCAIASNAELIVTNDKDFNPLKAITWPKVEIMTIQDFVKVITQ